MTPKNDSGAPEDQVQAWIPVLDLAAHEVFHLMLSSELGNSTTIPPNDPTDVTAMVGLAGKLSGVMTVRCQEKAASLIASKMLGIKLDEVRDEISDAMGEVCNMVAGNFKNKIPGLSDGCMLSPPTVITGNDYMVHSQAHAMAIEKSFLFENMLLLVVLQVHG
jgi:chemotaxis protein CheX